MDMSHVSAKFCLSRQMGFLNAEKLEDN